MSGAEEMQSGSPSVFVGLDIGGTKFLVAAANARGEIIRQVRNETPEDLQDGLRVLDDMIRDVLSSRKPIAIGAAIGGPLDYRTGIVSPLHQPSWRAVPLKSRMEEKWNCPCTVDVDTNAAALGEYRFGTERPTRLLYLTISTGMGGGFLIDGELYRGNNGAHPEIGHQSIQYRCTHPEKVSCECGAPDCLEALVSGNGIRRIYGKAAEQLSESEWDEVAFNLGQGLRNAVALYAPDRIVLGGGVAIGGGAAFISRVVEYTKEHLYIVAAPDVRLSSLGYETALKGAVALAMQSAEDMAGV